ncbi:MAG: right-handed parallel beta-helix repeat-containing protein [Promethearchaeota archaeon]
MYYIENVTINAENNGSCLLIQNSRVNFVIKNCTLYNSGYGTAPDYEAGIKLVNTTNGRILENDCSNNGAAGIYLHDSCENITISGNTVNYNYYYGICLNNKCNKNNISGNNAYDNYYHGIYLNGSCSENTVSGNFANDNRYFGIALLFNSSNNIISGNTANGNGNYGILISSYSDNNSISENTASYNDYYGIRVSWYSDNTTITENRLWDNDRYDVYLIGCTKARLRDNEMDHNGLGIYGSPEGLRSHDIDTSNKLYYFRPIYYLIDETGLDFSDIAYSTFIGQIFLVNCSYSTISGIHISDTSNAISLYYSSQNTIRNNYIDYNQNGVYLRNSWANNIKDNNMYNNENGIYLDYLCTANNISENEITYNEIGILLEDNCTDNTISANIIEDNSDFGIQLDMYCDNNDIVGNILRDNIRGLYLWGSSYNTIYLNIFDNQYNAYNDGIYNQWDNGIQGNYWNDYRGYDFNMDGIGDVPHEVPAPGGRESFDRYPLISYVQKPSIPFGGPYLIVMVIAFVSFVVVFKRNRANIYFPRASLVNRLVQAKRKIIRF